MRHGAWSAVGPGGGAEAGGGELGLAVGLEAGLETAATANPLGGLAEGGVGSGSEAMVRLVMALVRPGTRPRAVPISALAGHGGFSG
ncbi:MAG: hypothetical protein SFZ23_11345 [Planctomycetota bacterium]|nr:hypothetical protein [Planctomycetota bacterium]